MAPHEPGVYPAIPVQDYSYGPIEDTAMHYVQLNRVVEQNATRKKQEDNVRAAELDFVLNLETLGKGTAAGTDLIDLNCCIEDNILSEIPNEYKAVARKLTHRWGITLVDDNNNSAEDTMFRRTQCLTLWTSWDQQDV